MLTQKTPPPLHLSARLINQATETAYHKAKKLDSLKTPIAIAEGNLQLILHGQITKREYLCTVKSAYQALQRIKKILLEDYEK